MKKKYYCSDCKEEKSSKGTHCKSCRYKYAKRPSGLKYNIKTENRGWFKKGHAPWNKGIQINYEVWNKGTKGMVKRNKGSFTSLRLSGAKNYNWKGDGVGYFALHMWLARNFVKPKECDHCGECNKLDWANKTYKYLRDRDDWLALCKKCHAKYDIENGRGRAVERYPEIGRGQYA